MSNKTVEVRVVPTKSITPDETQPRKFFSAEKMKTLMDSIKEHGIINPIIVQEVSNGKYLIEDGERRFRAASELQLSEVPVIIRPLTNATERLVQQFNIQEQHEVWSPIEKARAIATLAEELKLDLREVCKMLNVTTKDMSRYVAFANLSDREAYIRSEVPLDYVTSIVTLTNRMKDLSVHTLEEDFTKQDSKKVEGRIAGMIRDGVIARRADIVKLTDAFTKNPKLMEKFMNDAKATPNSLFTESKAKGAFHLRNATYAAHYLRTHVEAFLLLRDVEVSPEQLAVLKKAVESARRLIEAID